MINYRRRGLDVTADGRDREMMTTVTITRGTDMPVHLVPVIRRFVILLNIYVDYSLRSLVTTTLVERELFKGCPLTRASVTSFIR